MSESLAVSISIRDLPCWTKLTRAGLNSCSVPQTSREMTLSHCLTREEFNHQTHICPGVILDGCMPITWPVPSRGGRHGERDAQHPA